jgi:hypothetical protein
MTDSLLNRQDCCCVVLPAESFLSRVIEFVGLYTRQFCPSVTYSNNCLISRNISCRTWSPICLPPLCPAFHIVCSCLSNLPSAYRPVPVQEKLRQLCIGSQASQLDPQSALFSALYLSSGLPYYLIV